MQRPPRRNKRSDKPSRQVVVKMPAPRFVPVFVSSKVINCIMRYQALSAVGVTISRNQLLSSFGCSFSTTQAYRLPAAVLLKRVVMYDQPAAIGSAQAPITLTWLSQYAPEKTFADQSNSVYAAKIDSRPPKNSTASFWSVDANNEAENLFSMTTTTGTIVDLHVQILLQNDFVVGNVSVTMTFTVASLIAGQTIYTYLDKLLSAGSAQLRPSGVATAV
jgi:hypothetical protein